jgi:glutamine amidotransferase
MKSGDGLKVPHIGFNEVEIQIASKLFRDLPDRSDFYFVHSYQLLKPPKKGISAFSTYGETFVSAFEAGNIFATQFHPEKSQSNGLKVLQNFLELPND